jgi:hypothetical protein
VFFSTEDGLYQAEAARFDAQYFRDGIEDFADLLRNDPKTYKALELDKALEFARELCPDRAVLNS